MNSLHRSHSEGPPAKEDPFSEQMNLCTRALANVVEYKYPAMNSLI